MDHSKTLTGEFPRHLPDCKCATCLAAAYCWPTRRSPCQLTKRLPGPRLPCRPGISWPA
jgi:hypothetical protein